MIVADSTNLGLIPLPLYSEIRHPIRAVNGDPTTLGFPFAVNQPPRLAGALAGLGYFGLGLIDSTWGRVAAGVGGILLGAFAWKKRKAIKRTVKRGMRKVPGLRRLA